MQNFTPNPIVITKDNIPIKIIPMEYDYEIEDFYIEIFSKSKKIYKKTKMDNSILLSFDTKLEPLKIVYSLCNGVVLGTQIIDKNDDVKKNSLDKKDVIFDKLKDSVLEVMDYPKGTEAEIKLHTEMLKKAITNKDARIYVTSKIRKVIASTNLVNGKDLEKYTYNVYAELYGMGVLQNLDDDLNVGEIMVNASVYPRFRSDIYYIKNGKKYKSDKQFKNLDDLKKVFSRCIQFNKKELNSVQNAIIEATRENKDRVNIVIPDASENYILNIRKFANFVPDLNTMKKHGTIDSYLDKLFEVLVKGKANIGIGGEMGTGKTTLINYLLTYTDKLERKVVIASVSETDVERVLKGHDVVIFNVDDEKGFTFDKLIRSSLRTTASRVIIPESRGSEFKQVYEANLKTKGNMFTAHALDDYSFLDMCTDMYLSSGNCQGENSEYIKNKLSKSIDIVVIMRKVGKDIRIKSISEVYLNEKKEFEKMNVLYEWSFNPENPSEGCYKATGNKMSTELKKRLNENGVPMSMLKDL